MGKRQQRRWRRYNRGITPWYLREVGGAPYWLIVAAGALALGVLAVILLN
jgi:hypothetical protein